MHRRSQDFLSECASVASLRLVSPGEATDGVILFFPQKSDHLLVIVSTPTLSAFQVIILSVNSAAKKFDFYFGVTLWMVSPRAVRPPILS